MCCIVANLCKIFIFSLSVIVLFVVSLELLTDLYDLRKVGYAPHGEAFNTLWMMHCFCGTLMTVLKLKDICYLHWWQLMTLGFIIGGFFRIYLQPAKDGLGMGQTVTKYFILEYMLLTLLLVAGYTRVLRSQEEV